MRVFVTGGTGLVGSHTIRLLVERGDRVLALSRSAAGDAVLANAGAEPLRGDVGDETALVRGVEECDAVVHAAAVVLSRDGWARFHAVNVAPVEALARDCAHARKRLVHLSSVAVYGRATTYDLGAGSVTEDFGLDRPLFAGDHYARSKREAELALWRIARESGLSAAAIRPCVIYGEGDRAFAIRVAKVLRRGIVPIVGDGGNPLSVVYAGNVAAAVVAALDRPAVTGAFNVCNDGSLTQREFVEHFARGMEVSPRYLTLPRAPVWQAAVAIDAVMRLVRPGMPMTTLKNAVQFLGRANPYVSARAEQSLGWRPLLPASEAVERTGRWFRNRI